MKPPMSRSLHRWKHLQFPLHDQYLNRSMLRNPRPDFPERRRSLTCSPAIWFMQRASNGWNTKDRATAQIFTKMGTRQASWADLKQCAAQTKKYDILFISYSNCNIVGICIAICLDRLHLFANWYIIIANPPKGGDAKLPGPIPSRWHPANWNDSPTLCRVILHIPYGE